MTAPAIAFDSTSTPAGTPGLDPELERYMLAYRAQGATDDQMRQLYAAWQSAHGAPGSSSVDPQTPAPAPDASVSLRNLMRSLLQGASFGFSDEAGKALGVGQGPNGLADRASEKAFQTAHPYLDAAGKIVGGAIAPAVLAAAAPEGAAAALGLTGVRGALELGALEGGANAAGDAEGSLTQRLTPAAVGALMGAGGGAALYGGGKAATSIGGAIVRRFTPTATATRAVARAAGSLVDDPAAVAARMNEVNALAPGGSSIATATTAPGSPVSRFASMARAVGAGADGGRTAEQEIAAQLDALDAGRRIVGKGMDALDGELPITPNVRAALTKVRAVLGGNAPDAPAPPVDDTNPLGIEKSTPFSFDPAQPTLSVQDARDALGRLRYLSRQFAKRGVDANGISQKDVNGALAALRDAIYQHAPDFQQLDQQYASLSNEVRAARLLQKTVQSSRANYAANAAYGTSSGSLGGSLPRGAHGVALALLDRVLPSLKAPAADVVTNTILTPRDGSAVAALLDAARPALSRRIAAPLSAAPIAAVPPAVRGLLFPADSTP